MAFEGLTDKLAAAFKKLRAKGKLTEADVKEAMREVRLALLEADVNYKVAKDFIAAVSARAVGADVLESLTPAQQLIKIVNDELTTLMGSTNSRINISNRIPTVIMMCGLQGAGKTTHAAKLARHFRQEGRRPMLVACDIYRPAAIQQLQVVGAKAEAPVFERGTQNPVITAKEAISYARDHGHDIVILDTAGRLHIDEELMEELRSIKSEVVPHEILLVIDSMVGQDAVNVAKSFDEDLGIDGVILTKLDGDTRGGAALSVKAVTGKPIKFVGTGEKLEDLEPFHPDRMASRILGMGDVLTLIEKAQTQVDEKEALEMAQKMKANSFDLNDLLSQMKQMQKMGPLGQLINMFPGLSGKVSDDDVAAGEKQLKKIESMIYSMTPAERAKPNIINPSRKRRIAAGSGTKVEDVNRLLKQFEQMQKMMKQLGGMGGGKGKRRKMMAQLSQMTGGGGFPMM